MCVCTCMCAVLFLRTCSVQIATQVAPPGYKSTSNVSTSRLRSVMQSPSTGARARVGLCPGACNLLLTLFLLFSSSLSTHARSMQPVRCLVVRDVTSAQDVKIEAHGRNSVRVRAVPSGAAFRDAPDIVSALVSPSIPSTECYTVALTGAGQGITSGNLNAAVGADGKLTFTRVSDGKVSPPET